MTEEVLNEIMQMLEAEFDKCASDEMSLAYAKCVLIILKVFRNQQLLEQSHD